jgi:beta-glucosidase
MNLFDALHAIGRPIVVVFINGRPVSEPRIAAQAHAIVQAGFLGEQGGHALARVLAGDVNPGGKLPLSIAQHVGTLPVFYNHKPSARRGYLFDEVRPLWPFGFGLSYTRFEFGAPQLSATSMSVDGQVQVRVRVRNVGDRAGDEVVQLYLRDLVASVTRPVLELKGFQRVTLEPGQSTTVAFTLRAEALALWNARLQRVVEPGDFDIHTGPDSTQLQSTRLRITGS